MDGKLALETAAANLNLATQEDLVSLMTAALGLAQAMVAAGATKDDVQLLIAKGKAPIEIDQLRRQIRTIEAEAAEKAKVYRDQIVELNNQISAKERV